VPKADIQIVAKLLREHAQRTALRGGNPYQAKAYSRAADSLTALAIPLEVLVEEGRLTEISGIGEAISPISSPRCIGQAAIGASKSYGRKSPPASLSF
jgi:DNA polymerase (family 10)